MTYPQSSERDGVITPDKVVIGMSVSAPNGKTYTVTDIADGQVGLSCNIEGCQPLRVPVERFCEIISAAVANETAMVKLS